MRFDHFCAEELETHDGYTFTLPSRLGRILQEVETLYGKRDQSWALLGIEFGPGSPQLWYPRGLKNIVIQLASNALDDTPLACYQLAHECVHLLSPTGGNNAPVFEEGVATVFSEDYVKRTFDLEISADLGSYSAAAALVRELLLIDPQSIFKLRSVEPAFTLITEDTFKKAGVQAPSELIQQLLMPFQRT